MLAVVLQRAGVAGRSASGATSRAGARLAFGGSSGGCRSPQLEAAFSGSRRAASSLVRRRRRAFYEAVKDPSTHPGKVKKLREKAAVPTYDDLRYLAENKIGKAVTTADRRALWFDMRFKRYAPVFLGQFKPRMKFWTAALEESQLPLARLPEVAIAGRSNSGKSTLVNYLCGHHSANVRRTPGSTTELVFWQIGKPAQLCLVDLPGYGFALAPEETRLQWTEFTLWYVRSRRNLKRVLLLLDSRFGLKPADREMIAYLERHNVSWQAVLTKTDKVLPKDLARKITILKEDCRSYEKMAGDPIPISALKRQGLETLRATMDSLKVAKDVVREGIKLRVYDLLEMKRMQRAERARRNRERKREQAEEEERLRAEEEAAAAMGLNVGANGNVAASPGDDLHRELEDYYSGAGSAAGAPAKAEAPVVAEAHYSLEDRDSQRVDSFMRELFPDLVDGGDSGAVGAAASGDAESVESTISRWQTVEEPQFGFPDFGSIAAANSGSTFAPWAAANDTASAAGLHDSDSESDLEDDLPSTLPPVMRFEPAPAHALSDLGAAGGGLGFVGSSGGNMGGASAPQQSASPFPGIGGAPSPRLQLRSGWARPSASQDRIYDEDDFGSPQDRAQGLRPWAPPPPTPQKGGTLIAEARRRYEREWAMELDDVERMKTSVVDSQGGSPRQAATFGKVVPLQRVRGRRDEGAPAQDEPASRRPLAFIGKDGLMSMPKGHRKYKLIGRPPAKILKQVRQPDAAKAFGFKDKRQRRKRNLGSDLNEEQAKDKWVSWATRTQKRHPERVREAQQEMEDTETYGAPRAAFGRPQPRYHRGRQPYRRSRPDQRNPEEFVEQ